MNKLHILLVCLFGLSCLLEATAHGIDPCEIGYYGVPPPPVCKWVTRNGKRVQECTAVGGGAYAAVLDDHNLVHKNANFPLSSLDFSGYCRCTLTLYSLTNNKGYYLSYPFSKSKTKKINATTLWKRATKSFKVVCAFPV